MSVAVTILVAGLAAVLLQRFHAAVSAEQDATADALAVERERLTGWAHRLVAHEARTRPHSARCPTAAECLRNLSTINALTVQLYDRAQDPTDPHRPEGGGASAGPFTPAEADSPWIDSL